MLDMVEPCSGCSTVWSRIPVMHYSLNLNCLSQESTILATTSGGGYSALFPVGYAATSLPAALFLQDNVSELLKEANLLGSVRHPNIVWVYGLVLPPLDAAIEAVRQGLGPGQGIDAVKVTMQMAHK